MSAATESSTTGTSTTGTGTTGTGTTGTAVRPFSIPIAADAELDDPRARISATR